MSERPILTLPADNGPGTVTIEVKYWNGLVRTDVDPQLLSHLLSAAILVEETFPGLGEPGVSEPSVPVAVRRSEHEGAPVSPKEFDDLVALFKREWAIADMAGLPGRTAAALAKVLDASMARADGMPKLLESIIIDDTSIMVDGVPFPYYVTDDPRPTVDYLRGGDGEALFATLRVDLIVPLDTGTIEDRREPKS